MKLNRHHRDKNHISYKIDIKEKDKLIACTSMRNINISKKMHIINKDNDNKKEQEKNNLFKYIYNNHIILNLNRAEVMIYVHQ